MRFHFQTRCGLLQPCSVLNCSEVELQRDARPWRKKISNGVKAYVSTSVSQCIVRCANGDLEDFALSKSIRESQYIINKNDMNIEEHSEEHSKERKNRPNEKE